MYAANDVESGEMFYNTIIIFFTYEDGEKLKDSNKGIFVWRMGNYFVLVFFKEMEGGGNRALAPSSSKALALGCISTACFHQNLVDPLH